MSFIGFIGGGDDRCADPRCRVKRFEHWRVEKAFGDVHVFVEPTIAPAPQPPADAPPCDCPGEPHKLGCARNGVRTSPAAPPVTGDGDLDEIAERWLTMENPPMGGAIGRVYGAVREALQRGRALGAREENVACERLVREMFDEEDEDNGLVHVEDIADSIAGRR